MKNKTIDKLLVKLDEIASILKQAKLENGKGIDYDELDGLARTIEMFSAKPEEHKATETIPQKLDKVSEEDLVKERDNDLEHIEEWCIRMLQKIEKEHKGDFSSGYQRMNLIKAFANGYKKHIDCVFKRGLKRLKDKKQPDSPEEIKERRLKTIEDYYNQRLEEINNDPKLDELDKRDNILMLDVMVNEFRIQVDRECKCKRETDFENYIWREVKASTDDILWPIRNGLLSYRIETLYNAIIKIKADYRYLLVGRVFNYKEIELIIDILRTMIDSEWNVKLKIQDKDKYINHPGTQHAMFFSGWYANLESAGITCSQGSAAIPEIKFGGLFYPLLASVLALDEWTKENDKNPCLTSSFDYILTHDDFTYVVAKALGIYKSMLPSTSSSSDAK